MLQSNGRSSFRMNTRRGKKGIDIEGATDLAEKHQKFVEIMQNPAPLETADTRNGQDCVDGNGFGKSKMERSFHLEELPDGSHISPIKVVKKDNKDRMEAKYIGSFSVVGEDQVTRAEFVRKQLADMREVIKSKPVLLAISLSGIKVCSSNGESVYMAHALKRISYATCDPEYCQFSFLAREPKGHTSTQYCHAFVTPSPQEAEELNTIIGNAFKMAYACQREQQEQEQQEQQEPASPQQQSQAPGQPTFNQLIERQISEQQQRQLQKDEQKQQQLANRLSQISTATVDEKIKERKESRQKQMEEMERQRAADMLRGKERVSWAKHIVGRTKHKAPFVQEANDGGGESQRPHSTACDPRAGHDVSDQSSPSKFRSFIELRDSGELRAYGSPVMTLKETIDSQYELNGGLEGSPLLRDTSSSSSSSALGAGESTYETPPPPVPTSPANQSPSHIINRPLPAVPPSADAPSLQRPRTKARGQRSHSPKVRSERRSDGREDTVDWKRLSGRYQNESPGASPSPGGGPGGPGPTMRSSSVEEQAGVEADDEREDDVYQGPPTPLRYDSLRRVEPSDLPVDEELQNSPWYQAGIPREIALELLAQQEIGAFIVRDSTSHKGCYALSVKVPKFDNPMGISHYLITRTQRGAYRLKGVEKEWPSLTALVTHHTVMPEMLPCTLRLPRNSANPAFKEADNERDNEDDDYQRLADFSAMMTELKM